MEQAWYLFPGQTLETTKIEDRGKALIATPEAWKKITDHLHKKKYQQDALDVEEARKNYLKEGSYNMTKNWDDSFEKIQQRRMIMLEQKAKIREENLVKRFLELRAEQQEERVKILEEIGKRAYMYKDRPRQINSSLLLSEVLYERQLQVNFNKLLREHEHIEEMNEAKVIKNNAEQEVKENIAKQKWRRDTDVNFGKELKNQIKEIEENEKKIKEEKLKKEIEDNIVRKEEMEDIEKYEFEMDKKNKAEVKRQFLEFSVIQKNIKDELARDDETEERIIKIYQRAKCRIDEKKKQKVDEALREQIITREKIAAKIMAQQMKNDDEENIRLANSIREKEERDQLRLEREMAYKEQLRQDRITNYQENVKLKQKQQEDKKNLMKWDMVNRIKADEVLKKYEQDKLQKAFDEKIKYRGILNEQVTFRDKKEYKKKCFEAEIKQIEDKNAEDDKAFFAYAQEVLDLAKSRNRSTVPIEKVIEQYKVDNNLVKKQKNISILKSNVPLGENIKNDEKLDNKKAKCECPKAGITK